LSSQVGLRAQRASRLDRSGAASRRVVYETAWTGNFHATEAGLSLGGERQVALSSLGQGDEPVQEPG
jgi:hypothetical protein